MDAQLLLDQNKQIQFEQNKTEEVMQQTTSLMDQEEVLESQQMNPFLENVEKAELKKEEKPKSMNEESNVSFCVGEFQHLRGRHWKLDTLFSSWNKYLINRENMEVSEKQVLLKSIISWGRKWYWTSWSPFSQSRENNKAVSKIIDSAKEEYDRVSDHSKVTQVALDAAGWVGSAAKAVGKGLWSIAGFLPIPGRTEYMAASGANTMGTYGGQGHFMEKEGYEMSMQKMRDNYDITKSYSENRQKALGNTYYKYENEKLKSNEGRNATYVTAGRSWISKATNVVMGLTAGFVGRNIFNMAAGTLATGWNLATVPVSSLLYLITKSFHSLFTGKNQFSTRGYKNAVNFPTLSVPVPHSPAHWIKYYAQNTPNAMDVFHERGLLEGIRAAIHFNVYRPVYDFFADFKRESGNLKPDENADAVEKLKKLAPDSEGAAKEKKKVDDKPARFKNNNATHASGPSHLFGGGLQTAWGPLTNMFKRLKNVGKFLTFQGIGSGILNPEKEEIAQRAKAETDEILKEGTEETLNDVERENILYNF